ncbi:MAG: hypothetical protein ACYDBV_13830 [Nitrospiria bacterium]
MEIKITLKRILIIFAIVGIIILLGHIFPQQFDNLGDTWFGPIFYGRAPN